MKIECVFCGSVVHVCQIINNIYWMTTSYDDEWQQNADHERLDIVLNIFWEDIWTQFWEHPAHNKYAINHLLHFYQDYNN